MGIWTDAYDTGKRRERLSAEWQARCAQLNLLARREQLRQYELESYAALGKQLADALVSNPAVGIELGKRGHVSIFGRG